MARARFGLPVLFMIAQDTSVDVEAEGVPWETQKEASQIQESATRRDSPRAP